MTLSNSNLRSFYDRIMNLEGQRYDLKLDIDEIYSEAKEQGYNVPALRELIREGKEDQAKRAERERIKADYRDQLDMFANVPSLQVDEPVYDSHPPFIGVHAVGAK